MSCFMFNELHVCHVLCSMFMFNDLHMCHVLCSMNCMCVMFYVQWPACVSCFMFNELHVYHVLYSMTCMCVMFYAQWPACVSCFMLSDLHVCHVWASYCELFDLLSFLWNLKMHPKFSMVNDSLIQSYPAGNYLLKVNNRKTRTRC